MTTTKRLWMTLIYSGMSLVVSASLWGQEQTSGQERETASGPAQLDLRSSDRFGRYLVDGEGMALYMFTADQRNETTCYDRCAERWPPLLTEGEPELAAEALDRSLVATIERRDGSTQVTYGGWPLYSWFQDERPGDTTGQDVHGSGGEWYLVGPDGDPIETEPSATEEQSAAEAPDESPERDPMRRDETRPTAGVPAEAQLHQNLRELQVAANEISERASELDLHPLDQGDWIWSSHTYEVGRIADRVEQMGELVPSLQESPRLESWQKEIVDDISSLIQAMAAQTDHAIDYLQQNYERIELVQERYMARIASIDFYAEHISDLAERLRSTTAEAATE